jgi:hypothetical protein
VRLDIAELISAYPSIQDVLIGKRRIQCAYSLAETPSKASKSLAS